KLHRDGNTLYGSGSIMLFDMNGNLVRSVGKASSSKTEMQLRGLRQGNYVAKCEGKVLQMQIR
ncbi:glycoside hydrolase family 5 protein, partial [Candidatus Saccharibacteria bacterium]|nr:glycoside hydrolase family 5 protein [Candidatus Saccharibacteria bacterium]